MHIGQQAKGALKNLAPVLIGEFSYPLLFASAQFLPPQLLISLLMY
jgi:hypothetical protein